MTQKVQVSREVADALDVLREKFNDDRVLSVIASGKTERANYIRYGENISDAIAKVRATMSPIETAKSLINGYEVEKTPKEKVYSYYHELKYEEYEAQWRGDTRLSIQFAQRGQSVKHTLELLGLKIEGVNA